MEYSSTEILVIQRFVDSYRRAPESLTRGQGFIGFSSLTDQERSGIDTLVAREVIEIKPVIPEFPLLSPYYRFSNDFSDLGRLIDEGRVVLR